MTRTREIFRSQWMYLWLAIALTLASFTPAVSNTRLLADSYGSLAAFDSAQALPSWYLSTAVSRVDTPDSYQALPSWWSRASAAATAPIAPMAATIVASFDVTVPLAATAGVPFPTEIQALDDGGSPLNVAATVTLTTNSGQSITPKNVELIAGVATPDVTLTAAGADRLVRVISGTATGQAIITVDPAPASSLTVTPDSAVVQAGRTRTFTASGTDAFGNPAIVSPQWTTNGGTVNPTQNYYTVFTADTSVASGKLVTATENGVSANAVVDIVHGPFHHFGITPDPIGTRIAGTPFALTVEAQDEYGNRVLTFDATADLDDSTGTITADTISLDDGIGTTTLAITRTGTGIVISATAGVTTTATDGFTVVPNTLHHIRVNNVANNGGASYGGPVEMGTRTIDIYGHIDAWAGGYDQYDNYRGDAVVSWEGADLVGQGEFIPTSGISTTFTPAPVLSGSGAIRAVNAVPPVEDESGQINIQAPKLAITKSGPSEPMPAGGMFLYTINYTNVGNAMARGVRITETYDPRVTFVDAVPQPDVVPDVWTPGDVPPGASDSIILAVRVDNSLVPNTVLTNVVTIGGLRLEQDTFTETTHITSTPGLTMTLDGNPQPAEAGGTLVYQIHYENKLEEGTAPVSSVRVTMTYDARVTYAGFTSNDPDVVLVPGTDNAWDVGVLQAGEEGSINVTVDVNSYMEDQTQLVTSATIKSAETPAFTDVELTLVDAPALALIKTATPSPVEADAQLVYTLVYSNVGHLDTTALSITDAVPADTDYVSCLPSSICSRIGDIVVWQPGSLAPGAKRTATMVVNVRRNLDSGTVLTNTARARVINEEAYSATAQITTTVLGQPLLWLSIGNGVDEVEAGDALEYTLHYSNTGNANAYSTTIVVTPPSSQYVEDVDCEPSSACDPDDGQLVHSLGTVPGGVTGTLRMVASVKHPLPAGADRIVASATINTPTPGDPPEGNDAADEDAIATRPDLVVLVDYEDKMPWPGKRVTYTLNYVNIGHIATNDVWITVTSNPNAEFRGKTSSPGWIARGDGIYSYYVGDMGYPDGGELLFVVTLANTTFTTQTTDFDSTFEISDSGVSGEDANPSNNRYDAWLGVPDIVIEKVTVEPSVWRGEAGLLKATLRNVGTGDACGIYNPTGCVGFVLDPYLDPDTPPSSYPIDGFGDCFIEVFPIKPGIAKTVEISFTTLPRSQWPAYESGLCEASALNEIWLKVDNWDPAVAPYPDGSGWVPESNEYNNVYGPITPETELFLPLIMRRFMGP